MNRVLVTGADGQLGRSIRSLGASGYEFIFTDVAQLDIADAGAVDEAARGVDFVVNCAAYTAVDKAESEPDIAQRINASGPRNLAEAAARNGAVLVHISTDYVFDGASGTPYKEDDPTAPPGVYGQTKLEGERAIRSAGCRGVIIRTAWLYSEYGNNFVHTMLRLGASQETIRVVDDQWGSPTYAGDLAAAIMHLLPATKTKRGEIYHYSNAGRTNWSGFAQKIMELADLPARIVPIPTSEFPTPARRPHCSLLDKSKIINEFHLEIPAWEKSLQRCIDNLK